MTRRDVAGRGVEIADVQERAVVLVAAAEQRGVFDDHLPVGRDDRRRRRAVHALGVDDRGDELLFAGRPVEDEKRLIAPARRSSRLRR